MSYQQTISEEWFNKEIKCVMWVVIMKQKAIIASVWSDKDIEIVNFTTKYVILSSESLLFWYEKMI